MTDAIELTLPVRLVSLLNARENWRAKAARAKAQRSTARNAMFQIRDAVPNAFSLRVTITRIAPRELDDDNLAGSGKHVRDGIADALGIDDRDPRVKWLYAQRKGKPREYACHVRIEVAE